MRRWQLSGAKTEDLGRRALLPAPFDPQRAKDDNLQLSITICASGLLLIFVFIPSTHSAPRMTPCSCPSPSARPRCSFWLPFVVIDCCCKLLTVPCVDAANVRTSSISSNVPRIRLLAADSQLSETIVKHQLHAAA